MRYPMMDDEAFELATPSAKNMAIRYDIKLSHVIGSGRDGRIMKQDIIKYLKTKNWWQKITYSIIGT